LTGRIGGGRQNCGGESDSARTGPLRSRVGHAEVEAQTGATVTPGQRLTSPRKQGRFDQKLPDQHTEELHVPPGHNMEDAGWGNNGEENNLASCSFGSDTEYLAETYVIINSEEEAKWFTRDGESSATGYIGIG
jgi:hypothetical protein